MDWFPRFLFLTALGCLAAAQVAPKREIGGYFHRFMAWTAFFFAASALAVRRAPDPALIGATALAIVSWIAGRTSRDARALMAAGLAVVAGIFVWGGPKDVGPLAQGLASGAFIGATLTAMIAGHFYLNNARLPFGILVNLCRLVLVAGAVTLAVSLVLFFTSTDPFGRLERMFERGAVLETMLPLVRVLAGGVFALALAWMALSCAKIRSNQSATGILYALVGVVLIGEMASHYMTIRIGFAI